MNHASLFSGIGGFDYASSQMGWENIFQVEIDKFCNKVLEKNFPETKRFLNIKQFDGTEYKNKIDVLTGGFPCQDISYAKSWTTNDTFRENGINGKRSGLWFEYARIIDEIRPKFVVIENVAALQKQGLDVVLQTLSDIGYDSEWQIITASFIGAPHRRKRIWIVAYPIGFGWEQESIIFSKITRQTIRYSSEWESSRTICQVNKKKTLSESFGIYDGIPRKLYESDRIKSLGNSIVPQIALQIFKAIQEYDTLNKTRT